MRTLVDIWAYAAWFEDQRQPVFPCLWDCCCDNRGLGRHARASGRWRLHLAHDLERRVRHAAFAAAAGCLVAASRGGAHRRTWIFLACASISWGFGQVIWTWYESSGREVPFPSYADVGYLGLPLLAAIGLLSLPSATQSLAGRIRTLIDGMMIAGAVLLCSWVLVLDKVYAAGGDRIVPTLISLAYPLGDVVLITMALFVLLARAESASDRAFPMSDDRVRAHARSPSRTAASPTSAPPASTAPAASSTSAGSSASSRSCSRACARRWSSPTADESSSTDTGALGLVLPYVAVPSPSSRARSRSSAPGRRTSSSPGAGRSSSPRWWCGRS